MQATLGAMRHAILPALLILSACGEAVEDDHFSRDVREERAEPGLDAPGIVPVRIGELGPNFAACTAAGETRNLGEGGALPVRAAPFDTADEIGRVPAGRDFHVCSRSHDQKWFGIVYPAEGATGASCGVSRPVPERGDYQGPCSSGWVSSAFVRLTAGVGDSGPAEAN